jgi:hypothetical protein
LSLQGHELCNAFGIVFVAVSTLRVTLTQAVTSSSFGQGNVSGPDAFDDAAFAADGTNTISKVRHLQ